MSQPFLTVHLEMENPTAEPQTVFLEKGRCFEIMDPFDGLQNAVLAENMEITIPPHTETEVQIPAYCLNKYRKMDIGRHPATVTPFKYSYPCNDQEEIWKQMAKPAA